MRKGDIILVSFPFTDFSGNKVRPALVLSESVLDIIIAFITTQSHWKETADIELMPTVNNRLKKKSIIRLSKLATIEKKMALALLGELDNKELKVVDDGLRKIFQLK